ncbi:MAG TPA: GNAT family N-acetyltransferase [Gammaproteobacteria bacterium]|nr:GNAT family N-acetyltransferase [Gammaproteobacteria bacterium]
MAVVKNMTYEVIADINDIRKFFSSNIVEFGKLSNSTIFLTDDFLITWLECYSDCVYTLQFIVFYADYKIIGVAPLYIKHDEFFELRFICTGESEEDEVFSEYLDFLVRDGFEGIVVSQFLSYLDATESRWNKMAIDNYLETSFVARYVMPALTGHGYNVVSHCEGFRYFIELPETIDEFYQNKKGSFYSGLKRKRRHLLQTDGVSYSVVMEQQAVVRTLGNIKRLHNERWKNSNVCGAFESDVFFKFHNLLSSRLLNKGRLFLLVVEDNEQVISVIYGFVFKGVLSFYQSGYITTEYKRFSIGSVSHLLAIEIAIDKKIDVYDFMFGSENSYKNKYKCSTEAMFQCEIYQPGLMNSLKRVCDKLLHQV